MASNPTMNSIFEDMFPHLRVAASEVLKEFTKDIVPPDNNTIDTDVAKTDNGYTVYADLPGVKKEDVQVYINESGSLVISAKRTRLQETLVQSRRRHGTFKTEVSLPKDANTDTCNSSLKDGVLVVNVQFKSERVRKWVPVS